MQEHERKRRVRKIADPSRHRRHQRKKLLRKVGILFVWIILVVACALFVWVGLAWLIKPIE